MIKYNGSNINDWHFYTSDIVKVYRNGAVVYYKVTSSGSTPTFDVCYAVVDDISQYQETEFIDVYNKADSKWYKLNNLNQYEEYGVYGNGRNITYYEGKLTVDDGYEYQYSGGSWVNVGEVSGSTATLPDVPFTLNYNAKEYNPSTHTIPYTEGALNAIDAVITGTTANIIDHHEDGYIQLTGSTSTTIRALVGATNFSRSSSNPNITIICKAYTPGSSSEGNILSNRKESYNWMYRHKSTQLRFHGQSEQGEIAVSNTEPNICSVRIDSSRLLRYNNWTQNTTSTYSNFSYGSNSNGGALFSGYYSSNGEFWKGVFYWIYMSLNTLTDDQVQQVIAYNEGGGGQTEYPVYYDEKSDPLNNLSFSSMTEATEYAYNNCVYDGMKATIDGDRYYFDSTDENGWVKILSYYKVEDVSPNGVSAWTITDSTTYNPNRTYYDDFDLETSWADRLYKVAKVTIFGYENFTYYLRSYNGYSSSYGHVMATNIDELQSDPTSMNYNDSRAITNTYYFPKNAGSTVNLSNYRRVTYNNLDKTVEHTFYVVFYGRTFNDYIGNATILIPKEQANENWEQVTFSSSTNVASGQKTLSIDGNSSTSGGTGYFYSRWIVGLPSGSHNSYVSYSNYDYCPNVTSSTFTSIEGEQRQVNFTYDNTTTKSLSVRLVDDSGNTINTGDTVYYNFTGYNSCNISSTASNTSFPRSINVKVGGKFRFGNSNNRHYIYGYAPSISLNTDYYVDNYQSTFDITYTKLSEEAVTITYITYDPNDVETPAFSTDISWPYGDSGTSSTTLTSYEVPYTYSYTVNQTSNLFSASTASYTYTAGQASRTISFTLYPNNREFSTVADLEAYAYAWEGMKASVDGTKYKYENGEWTENQYVVPSGYTELEYCTVPKISASNVSFNIKNNLNADYIYTFQFTPNSGFYDNYYGCVTTSDGDSTFKYYGIFKLDNGWGVEERRNVLCLYNYKFDTRSSGNIPSAFRYYIGVKATVIMKLHNPSDVSQGADLIVENEGYTTVARTSTSKAESSWTVVEGEFDMAMFTTNASNNCYSAQINYHNFKVEDTQGNLIYDYRPVTRLSDNKVGLYDVVNQQFFYPTGLILTAGNPV